MRHFRYSADDRERFADPYQAVRAKERLDDLKSVQDRLEALMGRAITDGQKLIEEAHFAGADFGGVGFGPAAKHYREYVEAAFEDALGTVRTSIQEAAE